MRARGDAGYVTAETAMVLPVLALLLAVGLWAVAVAGAQVRCVDAARDAARAVARGESDATATSVAEAAAPDGAQIVVGHVGTLVTVTVSARVGGRLGPLSAITAPTVSATATAESEGAP
jgi:Flp pilus assembly protein TadG